MINLRMKGNSISGKRRNAEAMLTLRGLVLSGRWKPTEFANITRAWPATGVLQWEWRSPDMPAQLKARTTIKPPKSQPQDETTTCDAGLHDLILGMDPVIVPITKENITKAANDGKYGWNGSNQFSYNGYHLGIYDVNKVERRATSIPMVSAFQGVLVGDSASVPTWKLCAGLRMGRQ